MPALLPALKFGLPRRDKHFAKALSDLKRSPGKPPQVAV